MNKFLVTLFALAALFAMTEAALKCDIGTDENITEDYDCSALYSGYEEDELTCMTIEYTSDTTVKSCTTKAACDLLEENIESYSTYESVTCGAFSVFAPVALAAAALF
eukprot:TRINITY_DN350_c0_g1_i4.p1 TRINITY_DN350_c0_g1~~TRINITY_DN350_c0_g1_i4.p1  ORF type:complete len:126 (-),score=33.39 TRINITY_DN350_c0_g1_i4:44-367(-)